MTKLAWVFPVAIVGIFVDVGARWGFFVPAPYFLLAISVGIAGLMGGQRSGFLAGMVSTPFLILAYLEQYGPIPLISSPAQVVLASGLFSLTGITLGRLRDQRDASLEALRQKEQNLESELHKELAKNAVQTANAIKSEARLSAAVRIAGIGHFAFDVETGDCTYCSDQHAANLGVTPEEFCRRTAGPELELFYILPDDRHIVLEVLPKIVSGESHMFEYRALLPDGEIRYIRESGEPIFDESGKVTGNVGTTIDLTELREAEARSRQALRIDTIGTLTGGVAHDFNNLLAVILGNLELSLDRNHEADRTELIQASIKAAVRGAGLTKNLLSFARRAHLDPTRLNLNLTIQNTIAWGTRVLPATISIENSLMVDLWDVELDATSIENALINILLNANDAMPDGGKVTIETANIQIGNEHGSVRHKGIKPGRYVMLAISDTGHGIQSDKLEKVFEPFYTRKPTGKGSGLGLSMVQGFIKQSGGAIRIHSEVDVGTTFKLYFKAAEREAHKPQHQVRERPKTSRRHAEILIAEDEEPVMRVLERILGDAGYSVTTANSGDEALEAFNSSSKFDLLLTDVVMPGKLQGSALVKEIRTINPDLPCVFLSGYASEATTEGNDLRQSDIRLMKPVSRLDLLHAVSRALESATKKD